MCPTSMPRFCLMNLTVQFSGARVLSFSQCWPTWYATLSRHQKSEFFGGCFAFCRCGSGCLGLCRTSASLASKTSGHRASLFHLHSEEISPKCVPFLRNERCWNEPLFVIDTESPLKLIDLFLRI